MNSLIKIIILTIVLVSILAKMSFAAPIEQTKDEPSVGPVHQFNIICEPNCDSKQGVNGVMVLVRGKRQFSSASGFGMGSGSPFGMGGGTGMGFGSANSGPFGSSASAMGIGSGGMGGFGMGAGNAVALG
jgi:hypothetical protein